MTALLALGREIIGIVRVRRHVMGYALDNLDSIGPKSGHLVRIVGQQPDRVDPERSKHGGRMTIISLVIGKSEAPIGVDRIQPSILERIGAQLVGKTDPAPLLPQVEEDATT